MLESTPAALIVGTVLGFLSGLGIGGGSLLILWLTMVLGMDQAAARGINLLFFLPAAVTALAFRWKQGAVDWKTVLPATTAGAVAAALCSWLGSGMDTDLLKKIFGGLLLMTGLRELFYKPGNQHS